MTATHTATTALTHLNDVHEILRTPGPCITIVLPPYRPGEPAGSRSALLKSYIREAARQLAGQGLAAPAASALLEPLERYARDPVLETGEHWGQIVFRSPSVFERFTLTQPADASLVVAGSFAIRKVASELTHPHCFYVLSLAKTGVHLTRCLGLHCEEADLPPGVPKTLSEALALEPPDHDLENRSAAGSSTGAMRRVRFGTGSERERQHAHLADYYRLVDRGLHTVLRKEDAPLILAGVQEDTAIYQNVGTYPRLLKRSIPGGTTHSPEFGIAEQAYSILHSDCIEREQEAMAAALKRAAPARFSTDPDAILHAAFEGRVSQLYVNESAQKVGVSHHAGYRSWGDEDLLNLAAVQTVLRNGKYFELPGNAFPDGNSLAAIMRF